MAANSPETVAPRAAAHFESRAWLELEGVIDQLGTAARAGLSPEAFYCQLLERTVQSLAALGGVAWLTSGNGRVRLVGQHRWPVDWNELSPEVRREHEQMLSERARGASSVTTMVHHLPARPLPTTGSLELLVGTVPVLPPGESASPDVPADGAPSALAIVEIAQHGDLSPSVCEGQQHFLAAVCEVAAEYHALRELRELRSFGKYHRQLFDLSGRVHRAVGLRQTAYELANEGPRVIGCDRLSVAVPRGRKRARLLAASGVKQLSRRAAAVRQLEQLAAIAVRFNEPIYYADDTSDALPQVAELLEQYVDQSHARQVAIVPIVLPTEKDSERSDRGRRDLAVAVLIAEQFDARSGELLRDRVAEVARLSAPAFEQATRWDRMPLRWLVEPLGRIRDLFLPRHLAKTVAIVGALAALVATLVLVQADFTVEAPGALHPAVRRQVFASRTGQVDEVLVGHGHTVSEGEELVRLRDAELDLEWKRIAGELETATRQLDSVRATKSGRAAGDLTALEGYRLSAEQRQLEQQLANLRLELDLLNEERQSLVIRSPLDGNVITWDVDRLLVARPVERGEVLLTVADLDAQWQLEVEVPDDRIGYVLAARAKGQAQLPVEFRLLSNERVVLVGEVTTIAGLAEAGDSQEPGRGPTVRVTVAFDKQPLLAATGGELRPGMTARASIHCGERSLGYVWLHDIWDAAVQWLTF